MKEIDSQITLGVRTSNVYGSLLTELQQIWSDIGETEAEKDRMLLELETECLGIYRRKVEEAATAKVRLHQSVAAVEAEISTLMASLGVLRTQSPMKTEKGPESLKGKLAALTSLMDELKKQKEERIKQFADAKSQIEKLSSEISGFSNGLNEAKICSLSLEEGDLSLRKLHEYQSHLRKLQKEKTDRVNKVLEHVNEVHILCGVLGFDFCQTIGDVHPSLHRTDNEQSTNICDKTLQGLEHTILKLKTERKTRHNKLKTTMASLFELWSLMDSPQEEKNKFTRVISDIRCSESDITEPGILSTEKIDQVLEEVERLTKLKGSRMKELVMNRRSELEEMCRINHIEADTTTSADKSTALIDSGLVNPSELLEKIEEEMNRIRDEVRSRKEIMDRIDRWLFACEEENWLEEYNQDHSRYSAGRGAHINLKRAERARVLISKIPSMVADLINRTFEWEEKRHKQFLYDGVRLVSILQDYQLTRKQREDEKKRFRDIKKLQGLLQTKREAMYGSKPSPRRTNSFKSTNGYGVNRNVPMTIHSPRRNSVCGYTPGTPRSYVGRDFKDFKRHSTEPDKLVRIPKEDSVSTFTSVCGSEPDSPPLG